MTGLSATSMRVWREMLQAAAALTILGGSLIGGFVWVTGGFAPKQQIQVQQLSDKVGQLSDQIAKLVEKVNDMPRPGDYATIDARLAHHDEQFGVMGDRLTKDEIEAGKIADRVQRLGIGTETPVRQPR